MQKIAGVRGYSLKHLNQAYKKQKGADINFRGSDTRFSNEVSSRCIANMANGSMQVNKNISFKDGMNFIAPVEYKTLFDIENVDAKKIADKIKKSNKQPVIFSDFDGTLAGFVSDSLKSKPESDFKETIDMMKKKDVPCFLLSSRSIDDFDILLPELAPEMNLIGLKGSEMQITMPDNSKVHKFISDWKSKPNYNVDVKKGEDIKDGFVKIVIKPKLYTLDKYNAVEKKANAILKPFGFKVENKKNMQTLHWRAVEEDIKELELNSKRYNMVKHLVAEEPYEETITIKNGDKEQEISKEKLIKFGQNIFKQVSQEIMGDELKSDDVRLHLHEDSLVYELIDKQIDEFNKGDSLAAVTDLLGGQDEIFPMYFGDSVGKDKDDEAAIVKATEMEGLGIAVLKRDQCEFDCIKQIGERLETKSAAGYKLDNYKQTTGFIKDLLQNL